MYYEKSQFWCWFSEFFISLRTGRMSLEWKWSRWSWAAETTSPDRSSAPWESSVAFLPNQTLIMNVRGPLARGLMVPLSCLHTGHTWVCLLARWEVLGWTNPVAHSQRGDHQKHIHRAWWVDGGRLSFIKAHLCV